MKKILPIVLFFTVLGSIASAQKVRVNAYTAYVFDDKIDSYYDANSYYEGTIKGGFQWGVGLEYMLDRTKGIELKYLRQDTKAPMTYYREGVKEKTFDVAVNYILLGGSNYFETSSGKFEPYLGFGLGCAIIDVSNPDGGSGSSTKFAWDIKGGSNIWLNEKIGIKLQVELLSAVQSAGGGLYFGTGGASAGLSSYSSMLQFGMGGGLVFKMGN
ncbi:outer membrane beta-barrel protein [Flavihumibacter fluvii]|uniref:outer membrane beta-barrel protein n=1 Tax=Flavihumibacter fluvii TaxID=2838157 RepID=UPI001BDEEB27|nr:outer membrane beta-barrel protein [Flavihumibacter fluvii]ULQ54074.1 porin family protein [Flavihumibacter fluvii]